MGGARRGPGGHRVNGAMHLLLNHPDPQPLTIYIHFNSIGSCIPLSFIHSLLSLPPLVGDLLLLFCAQILPPLFLSATFLRDRATDSLETWNMTYSSYVVVHAGIYIPRGHFWAGPVGGSQTISSNISKFYRCFNSQKLYRTYCHRFLFPSMS